jgi:MEDS: MEthanogen/methylotroph, DcmR Sensory domain
VSVPRQADVIDAFRGEHLVQFYEDDAELIAAVGPYLVEAVRADEVAVVIATEPHRRAFDHELDADQTDLVRARANGRLVFLDAAETLDRIRADGAIDHGAFYEVIGGLMHDAAHSGRPVRVYGEMVALLWEEGDIAGAIELETLWNDVGRELPFTLYCSYPAASMEGRDGRHSICELHSSVVSRPLEFAADYPAEVQAPGRARRDVVALFEEAGRNGTIANAALIVTELATNAVRHAATPFSVAVRLQGSVARVAVSDQRGLRSSQGDRMPATCPHGLALVDAIATSWGVEQIRGGKTVWAEFPA